MPAPVLVVEAKATRPERTMTIQYRPLFPFVGCTERLLTEGRVKVKGRGRGRAISCGGRHMVSCERLERSVSSARAMKWEHLRPHGVGSLCRCPYPLLPSRRADSAGRCSVWSKMRQPAF